jgi:cation:H+ antiporter
MQSYVTLLAGIACAALGGEFFVRGAVGIARWARISPGIVAVTIAAFATSSPELSVSISAALAGTPEIALGDALGSNVVNVALILGVTLAIAPIRSPRDTVRRDFPVAVAVPLVTALLVYDGVLSRLEGAALFAGFVGWMTLAVREALRQRRASVDPAPPPQHWRMLLESGAGLGLLAVAGSLVVDGARGIALSYGLNEFVIGATVIAVGTSVPELATAVTAKLRGHDEVGLGTILGSNLFNGLFIVAVAAMIHPIVIETRQVFTVLAFGTVAVALTMPAPDGTIHRVRGALLLLLYAGFVLTMLV